MTTRRTLRALVVPLTLAASLLTGAPPSHATTVDNRDAWTGAFSDFALLGGMFVDPADEEKRAVAWLAVQRGVAVRAGYEGQSAIHTGSPLEASALLLWCPSPDLCLRRTPEVHVFTVDDDGSATITARDTVLGAIDFRWQPTGGAFNGIFLGCTGWIFGGGWYVEWDVSLHGATQLGWYSSVEGSVGSLDLVEQRCIPVAIRDKAGKVELAWSNEGETI